MPTYEVSSPDGKKYRVNAPDGATQEDAIKYVQTNFYKPEQVSMPNDPYAETANNSSALQNIAAGAGGSLYGMYLGAKQLLGKASPQEIEDHKQAMKGLVSTTSGTVGQLAGAALPAAATAFVPGVNTLTGSALVGAGMGALEPVGKGESRFNNMAIGAGAGAVGQKIAGAIGRFNRPVQSSLTPEKQLLAERAAKEGIPLNVAQQTGSKPLQIIDSVLDNMPLTADKQAAAKDLARQKFNAAVGRTFGTDEARLTPQVIEGAKRKIGDKFTELSQRNVLKIDEPMMKDVSTLADDVSRFDTPDVAKIVGNYVDDLLSKTQNGQVSGEAYRKFDSALGRKIRSTSNGDLRNALGRLQTSVREGMDRSISEADSVAWKQARREYANLMDVAPIAAKDVDGNVSAKLLWNKVNQKKTNLRDIAEVGKAFANEIPDSGTAQRTFYQRMIENPLTAVWQQGIGGLSMPLQSALNSPAGQRYFTKGLLDVHPMAGRIGRSAAIGLPVGATSLLE